MSQTCRVNCPECSARLRYNEPAERANRLVQCPHCSVSFIASFQTNVAATSSNAANALEPTRMSQATTLHVSTPTPAPSYPSSELVCLPAYVSSTPVPVRPASKPWLKHTIRFAGITAVVVLLVGVLWFSLSQLSIPSFGLIADSPERVRQAFWSVVRRHRDEFDQYHALSSARDEALQNFRFSKSVQNGIEDCFFRAMFLDDTRPMRELIQFSKTDTEQNTREGIARYYRALDMAKPKSNTVKEPASFVRTPANFEHVVVFKLEDRILELLKAGTGILPTPENAMEEALKPEIEHRRKLAQRLAKCLKAKSVVGAAADIKSLADAFEVEAKRYRSPPFARVAEEYHLADVVWNNCEKMVLVLIEYRFDPGDDFRDAVYAYECVGQKHCAGEGVGDYYAEHGLIHGNQRYVTPQERAKAIADKLKDEEKARKLAESKAAQEKARAEEKAKRVAKAAADEIARKERAEALSKERRDRMEKLEADLAARMNDNSGSMTFSPGMRPDNSNGVTPNSPSQTNRFRPDFAQGPGNPNRTGMAPPGITPFGPNSNGMPGVGNPKGPLADMPLEKILVVEVRSTNPIDFQATVKLLSEKLGSRRYQSNSLGKDARTIIARFAYDKSIEEAQAALGSIVVKSDSATRTLTVDGDQIFKTP